MANETIIAYGLEYARDKEGYWTPTLQLPKLELNMWGMARKEYLKTNNPVEFDMMLMSGEIFTHLETIQTQAQERYETLIEQKREALGVTEELKEKDWLKWVQLANGIQEEARQEVLEEMIYI
ncbi:TnpV protein [Ruminococcus sp.]